MSTVPDDLDAIAEALVRMELIRVAPVRCQLCRPDDPCWFHKSFCQHEPKEMQ